MADIVERAKIRVQGFENAEMDFQLLRQLGASAYGGVSIGECLYAASKIQNADPKSWVSVFCAAGKRQEADADEKARRKHAVSAREQYLKASNSYRAAEYFTDFLDPSHQELGLSSRACFLKAMAFAEHAFEIVDIPFEGKNLPAYFMAPDASRKPRKTLVIISGYDGTLEETYFQCGIGALQRGYNVFLFAGPGQMDTLRFHPEMTFIPEYEKVSVPALDILTQRPEVLVGKVGFMGISMGGYFCLRAAAFDKRINALIPNSPIANWGDYLAAGGFDIAKLGGQDFTPDELNYIPDEFMSQLQKEMTRSMIRRNGKRSFVETFHYLEQFDASNLLRDIHCPLLALVGAGEGSEAIRQLTLCSESVSGPVTQRCFADEEGSDAHCQVGNTALTNAVVCDWLDELFD